MLGSARMVYRRYVPVPVRAIVRAVTKTGPRRLAAACLYPVRFRYAYTRHYFLGLGNAETRSYDLGMIKPSDMGAAIGYAMGYRNLESVFDVLGADLNDTHALPTHMSGLEQVRALMAGMTRRPKLVLDVGIGRGELSALLNHCGIKCIAIEPAGVGPGIMRETCRKYNCDEFPAERFLNTGLLNGLRRLRKEGITPDTIILCESLEHIPRREFDKAFEMIRDMLTGTVTGERRGRGGILIIVNWPDYHPIRPVRFDWNHVRTVDDQLYDELASRAARTIFRCGSHLVLEF